MYDINKRLAELLQVPEVDFKSDARLVIEAMRKREDWPKFVYYIASSHLSTILDYTYAVINLIMDRTGELAKLALEWLERRD